MWKRLVATTALCLAACGTSQLTSDAKPDGALKVTVGINKSNLVLADSVTRIELSLTNGGYSQDIEVLSMTGGKWTGNFLGVPVGSGYTVSADAYNAGDVLVYHGSVPGVTVTPDTMSTVVVLAQEANPPAPYVNVPARIDGVTASALTVVAGGTLTFGVSAEGAVGDTLTYAWSTADSSGSFSAATATSTDWTAPALTDTATKTITIAVTNGQGAVTAFSFDVQVTGAVDTPVEVDFNTWPVVSDMTLSSNQVDLGTPVTVTATASDDDGDTLTYTFSANPCLGTWTQDGSHIATFTPTAGTGACSLEVYVDDGNGGHGTGYITLNLGMPTGP